MTNKFARTHVGVTMEHKILDDYKVKANVMTGTTSLLTAELTKTLKSNVDVIIG
jgi:RNase adaptor protein for sRNA GlmZ degradation